MKQAMSCGRDLERPARGRQRPGLGRGQRGLVVVEVDGRGGDARPVELGEPRDLHRVGVGQAHRVPGAAVEGVLQVQHAGAEGRVDAVGLVPAGLPVERDLERVLHRQRAAVDEEQVRQGRVAEHPVEGLHEPRHRHRVDVGVARLVDRDRRDLLEERGIGGEGVVVHAERGGREEREQVEVLGPVPGVDQRRTVRPVQVEYELEAVGEHVRRHPLADGAGVEGPRVLVARGEHCHVGSVPKDYSDIKSCNRKSVRIWNAPADVLSPRNFEQLPAPHARRPVRRGGPRPRPPAAPPRPARGGVVGDDHVELGQRARPPPAPPGRTWRRPPPARCGRPTPAAPA